MAAFYHSSIQAFKVSVLKYLKYLSGIPLLLLLTACNTPETPAPDYQGNWKNTLENPKLENILVISKNGENYFITNTIKDKESGKTDKKNPMPASVADNGLLQINSGTGVVDFAIDEKTGNLVGSGSVYKKAK
nr:hypothetical protein [Acinetobacter variabilis]